MITANLSKKAVIRPLLIIITFIPILWSQPVTAGEGYLSPTIPNDNSHHTAVDADTATGGMQPFVIPAGTRFTVIKVTMSISADTSNTPDFRLYRDPAFIATFDNPGDVKDVFISAVDRITNVEWLDDGNAEIHTFLLDHTQHRSGAPSDEEWQLEIKNNDTEPRVFFIGIGQSPNASETAAIAEATSDAEIPYIKVLSEPIDFGEVLIGAILPQDLPEPEVLTIANVGSGSLSISNFGNPDNPAFSHQAGVATPFPMAPRAFLNIPISFTPSPSLQPGPITPITKMIIENTSNNGPNLEIELAATPVKLEVVLLYDISGSMSRTPAGVLTDNPMEMRIGQAKLAGQQIQYILSQLEGTAVNAGLVTFPRFETPTCPDFGPSAFTKIPGPGNTSNVGLAPLSLIDAQFDLAWGTGPTSLQALPSGSGSTPLAEGLKVAHGVDSSNFGSGKWTEGEFVRRALVLLSDGNQYEPECDSAAPLETPSDWVTFLQSNNIPETRKIRIFTIPYGIPNTWQVDHDTLEDIAEATEGGIYDADALDFSSLYKQFRAALVEWRSDWSEIIDPKASLTKGGPTRTHDV